MKLIEKMDKNRKYEPTTEELKNAYGYLNYCLGCGEPITFMEAHYHCFMGNYHKFGCESYQRIFGVLFNVMKISLLLVLVIPYLIFYGIYKLSEVVK